MKTALRALLLFAAVPLSGIDLADLFRGALDRDLELKRIALGRENQRIAQARAQVGRGMQFSLDSSGLTLSREFGSYKDFDDWYVAAGNGVTFSLGEPFYTRFGVSMPVSYSTGTDTTSGGFRTGAGASITQPINPLLGWAPHGAEDMALRNAEQKAGIDRKAREAALRREIVGSIRTLVGLELKLFDADAAARDAREELEKTRALRTFEEGSYAIRRLEATLARLEKEQAQTRAEMALRRGNLEKKTGAGLGGSPVAAAVAFGEPRPPSSWEAGSAANSAVYLGRLSVELAAERLKEEGFKDLPTFSLRGGYNFYTAYYPEKSPYPEPYVWYHYPSLSLSMAWKIFDNGLSRLNEASLSNELAMARLGLQAAEEDYQASRAEVVLSERDMERRKGLLAEQKLLLELEVQEKADAFQKGIATEQELQQARTRLERLSYDDLQLRCDEWLLSIQAETLNLAVLVNEN